MPDAVNVASHLGVRLPPRSSSCCLWVCVLRTPVFKNQVVVDDFSLQRLGHHDRVARDQEAARQRFASKLTEAGSEITTKKSKVLSNSGSVRTMLLSCLVSFGAHASRADRNLGIGYTLGQRGASCVPSGRHATSRQKKNYSGQDSGRCG